LKPVDRAGADIHAQRVDDAVASEGIDLQSLLVGRGHLAALHVDVEDALVDPHQIVEEWKAPVEAGAVRAELLAGAILVEDVDRLAETGDNRLARLGHDDDRVEENDQPENREDGGEDRAAQDGVHLPAPCGALRVTGGSAW